MLAISPLGSSNDDGREGELGGFHPTAVDEFSDSFSGGDLLDDIDFDNLFVVGFDDGDVLPDLEVDPAEIFAEFSISGEESGATAAPAVDVVNVKDQEKALSEAEKREDKSSSPGEVVMSVSIDKESPAATSTACSSSSEAYSGRKPSSSQVKGSQGKRKVKVDWTPELHRRFVQAVEQLGVDKAVPSRILELMGIDCLTRHNIASHLQKYRSHRKHLLAREAEAASWSQRRQMYATVGSGAMKRDVRHPWPAPTIGFPPPSLPTFRPLHVWGHPSLDQYVWPKHLVRSPPPPLWVPHPPLPHQPPPPDPSYWHHHYPRVPTPMTQATPFFPRPMPAARFPAPPVQGVPPHPLYRPSTGVPPPSKHSGAEVQLDMHPSKESIDAAIGDVLEKPLLPLPLGLKPPSLESVMVELQRQGVSKVPPSYG